MELEYIIGTPSLVGTKFRLPVVRKLTLDFLFLFALMLFDYGDARHYCCYSFSSDKLKIYKNLFYTDSSFTERGRTTAPQIIY